MSGRWPTIERRFWTKVAKSDGCWEWQGWLSHYGYGMLTSGPRGDRFKHSAHRISWELNVGPIPDGLLVLHSCDNRRCVRPDHLFLGTNDDNMADMAAKGRGRHGPLTDAQVRQIRTSSLTIRAMAAELGITFAAVSRIRRRESYRDVA